VLLAAFAGTQQLLIRSRSADTTHRTLIFAVAEGKQPSVFPLKYASRIACLRVINCDLGVACCWAHPIPALLESKPCDLGGQLNKAGSQRGYTMRIKTILAASIAMLGAIAGGCASDVSLLGEGMTTSSITPANNTKPDGECVALMAKIDALRKEGTPGRIEKVADGKSETAVVKRAALQRISELDKTNAEFQQRCSKLSQGQVAAEAAAPAKPLSDGKAKTAGTSSSKQSINETDTKNKQSAMASADAKASSTTASR